MTTVGREEVFSIHGCRNYGYLILSLDSDDKVGINGDGKGNSTE